MTYAEKNKLVNQIHAVRRELTALENLVWRLHEEAQASQPKAEATPESPPKP